MVLSEYPALGRTDVIDVSSCTSADIIKTKGVSAGLAGNERDPLADEVTLTSARRGNRPREHKAE